MTRPSSLGEHDGHWIYFWVRGARDRGTIVDFVQCRGGAPLARDCPAGGPSDSWLRRNLPGGSSCSAGRAKAAIRENGGFGCPSKGWRAWVGGGSPRRRRRPPEPGQIRCGRDHCDRDATDHEMATARIYRAISFGAQVPDVAAGVLPTCPIAAAPRTGVRGVVLAFRERRPRLRSGNEQARDVQHAYPPRHSRAHFARLRGHANRHDCRF